MTPPTAPSNIQAFSDGDLEMQLWWTASTDALSLTESDQHSLQGYFAAMNLHWHTRARLSRRCRASLLTSADEFKRLVQVRKSFGPDGRVF